MKMLREIFKKPKPVFKDDVENLLKLKIGKRKLTDLVKGDSTVKQFRSTINNKFKRNGKKCKTYFENGKLYVERIE